MAETPKPIFFKTAADWRRWLTKHHAKSDGVWLLFYKKASGVKSIHYAEALDEALCYGWIDGQTKSIDAECYRQRFTPRRARSMWSQRNIEHVTRLEKAGKMRAAGRKQVEAAKADGRWRRAYAPPSRMTLPEEFMALVAKNKQAKAFFATLNRTNLYAIAWRLRTAKKPETVAKRMAEILKMLAQGKKFH